MPFLLNAITDVPGIRVGHAQNLDALTGCSVVLCPPGSMGGVAQSGGAPGTRETDALRPMHLVDQVHAILLAGGSAFGLDAAAGVMRYLEENGVGYDTGVARVPIVPAAILFDLAVGASHIRPDAAMGYTACQSASTNRPAEGNAGAGTGATAGKLLGMTHAMKTGIGTASETAGDLIVGALVAANPLGDILDPDTGKVLAGLRRAPESRELSDSLATLKAMAGAPAPSSTNTVIGVVATNARLTREEANYAAQMAQDGLACAIRPAHTLFDGDTLFLVATGSVSSNLTLVGALAARAVSRAIVRAATCAEPAGNLPSYRS